MFKISILVFFSFLLFLPSRVLAESYVTIVNPIRGEDFWDLKDQKVEDAVLGQLDLLNKQKLKATFLLRFDALNDKPVVTALKSPNFEKGLFLEITPSLTKMAGVNYRKSEFWHFAGSVFLTGYEIPEREKLIDTSFAKFKEVFGYYPKSVGAWWVDGYSLAYMESKYKITSSLIVADQYSTDNYQIWGQYWGLPFYPDKRNVLFPAFDNQNKLPVVTLQWAARDPINAYGKGVEASTLSVQANDYLDFHNLDINYFSKLVDIYTGQKFNQLNQITVGLENSYDFKKYGPEYQKQLQVVKEKENLGILKTVTMEEFSKIYRDKFTLSPTNLITANDPLGSSKKVIWFMNPYYRAGLFITPNEVSILDLRQYLEGQEELCKQSCQSINFATFPTRVLDFVTFGDKLKIEEGEIHNLNIEKIGDDWAVSFKNIAEKERVIKFMPKDISIDGKVSSIDSTILQAKSSQSNKKIKNDFSLKVNLSVVFSLLISLGKFIIFAFVLIFLPGLFLVSFLTPENYLEKIFLSFIAGLVILTIISYILFLLNLKPLLFILIIPAAISFKEYFNLKNFKFKFSPTLLLIICGVIFQVTPVFLSGLNSNLGIGFWGPNTHDGLWHISLINQLLKNTPPENPVFSGVSLRNYHYFYDLILAATNFISQIGVSDLLFRFFPILLSILLGIGTYTLSLKLFNSKLAASFGVYFVYFAGSFGWIVEFLRERHIGGESAFWANQAVSFNLNPPFALSLLLVISIFLLIKHVSGFWGLILTTLILGVLLEIKIYGAILIFLTILILGVGKIFQGNLKYLLIVILGGIITILSLIPNFSLSSLTAAANSSFIFSPFWFVHSMLDYPDRVGWLKLATARDAYFQRGDWLKFILAEGLGFAIFLIGNLGTRFIFLFNLANYRKIFTNDLHLAIGIFSLISLILPLLFIQTGTPWNTIQFIYYLLFISSLLAGFALSKLLRKFKYVGVLLTFFILIITPINSVVTANSYLKLIPDGFISKNELEGLNLLKSLPDGIVTSYPYDQSFRKKFTDPFPIYAYDSTSYVSALSGQVSFVEDEIQNGILSTDYKKRIILAKSFFNNTLEKRFLIDNNIKYIYLQKFEASGFDSSKYQLKKIFENQEIVIFKNET